MHGGVAELLADLGSRSDGGRDLDHFLVAALHRAVALIEVEDVAVAVAEDLHFDVLGAPDVALEEHGVVAESRGGLALGLLELGLKSSGFSTTRMPRPPPPNAALTISGKPICAGDLAACGGSVTGSSVPGTTGTPAFWASLRAAVLSPSRSRRSALGPMKVTP